MEYFKKGGNIVTTSDIRESIVRIGVVGPSNMINFMKYVEEFAPYGPFFVKMDVYGATILILDIWKENLKWKNITELIEGVQKNFQQGG